jgi:phosphoribosylformylglycinamidine synthase II
LTDGELARIVDLLEREPNHFELAVFSLLWSEHCGYKHSALLLKRLPSQGKRVLQGPGENAGVIDLGDGEAVCFKVESHNHPSAVEPFQGAATGVGGILRDIIAMGARPIALLDGLRFAPEDPRFDRAVAGIGAYGNSVGVPTVGGEAVFDATYRDNVLVNAMCVGLLPADRVTRAGATGPGNLVVLYGATTGRDGIGGASVLASQELGEDDADKRPTVQVGDPFTGKKLIEVSVELVESGLVESLQDCGAAGLASSLSEMARDTGIDLRLDAVPLREEGMEPWEVMISESQERMVAVVRPQMLDAVLAVCERWELHHAVVGEVTGTGLLRAFWDDEVVGEIPARFLTDECPRYTVEPRPRSEPTPVADPVVPERRDVLVELLGSPNLRSREWIFRRYDHLVGSRTVRRPGLDAAVLRLRPGYRGLAVSLDGQSRMGRLWPRTGGRLAVLEAARNVACTGAEPIGLTDCLNFGNPEKGEIAWELAESIEGMAEACEALRVPIVSGNVSLYNETDGRAIDPTPVVGCVGLLDDVRLVPSRWREGDVILLAGASPVALAGSELQARYGEVGGRPARLDLEAEAALVEFLWRAAPRCSLVHDVSSGGLAVALAEAAIHSGLGAELSLPEDPRAWFGEGGGQAVLACPPDVVEQLGGVRIRRLGVAGGDSLLGIPLDELREAWS